MKKSVIIHRVARGAILLVIVIVVVYVTSVRTEQHDRQIVEGEQALSRMLTLSTDDIESIVIYDVPGHAVLATVLDKDKQSLFLSATSQMVDWRPNHPSFKKEYYVVLNSTNSEKFEFEMCLKYPSDTTVYVYGVRKEGTMTYCLYRRQSALIKTWLDSLSLG